MTRASSAGRGVILLLLAAPCSVAQTTPDAETFFARGVALHQAGDLVGAIEEYQAALQLEPGRVDARSNLGAAFAKLGRYDEAIEHYRAVLAQVPEQAQVRFNLALALYKSARTAQAAEELEQVISQQQDHRAAVLLLADCRAQLGNPAGVVALLASREEEFKDDRLYAYLLGNALIRRNELLRGQAFIDRLFSGGETPEARLLMGVAHLKRGDARAALPELQRAAELNAELPTLHSLLGRAFLRMGRRAEALLAFRTELKRNPNDFDANVSVGLLLKEDGKLDEAFELLKRAERLRPGDPGALYALGALHLAAGRVDEARESLEAVTARAPEFRQAHVLLATAYYRLKKKDLAERERDIAEKLRADQQAREPGAADDLGPAYQGMDPVTPSPAPPQPPSQESRG